MEIEKVDQKSPMVPILISTFARYEAFARWTKDRILDSWRPTPPIFFSGLDSGMEGSLGFEGDPGDWMAVTRFAVCRLMEMGHRHAYLILDDHPPVGACHSAWLNGTLPSITARLDAACVSLLGYGQHRPSGGRVLGKDLFCVSHCAPDDRWKFSLHPALWNLTDLLALLARRMETYWLQERTPWNFERHKGDDSDPSTRLIATRCFRIHGASALGPDACRARYFLAANAIRRFAIDVALFLVKIRGGMESRARFEKATLWKFGHYLGPYPIFWSGFLQQGTIHRSFDTWARRHAPSDFRHRWHEFLSSEPICLPHMV